MEIRKANCANCYKCLRSCPVKAIGFASGQAKILPELCIGCGECIGACPRKAVQPESQLRAVQRMIERGESVVASLSPACFGAFGAEEPMKIVGALKALGFQKVYDSSWGANLVFDEMTELMEKGGMENVVSSCCPAVNALIEKHAPDLAGMLAPVVSPMLAHARYVKRQEPKARVVLIGSCYAAVDEARDERAENAVDAVLTFADVEEWLRKSRIRLEDVQPGTMDSGDAGAGRLYCCSGGVLENLRARGVNGWKMLRAEGAQACEEMLALLRSGKMRRTFVEMSLCRGSCMGGSGRSGGSAAAGMMQLCGETAAPVMEASREGVQMGMRFSDRSLPVKAPDEEKVRAVLRILGMEEFNCGACGYDTCRDMAAAVLQGRAEPSMCMPHMLRLRQNTTETVMSHMTDIVLIVDEELRIIELSAAGQRAFLLSQSEAMGKYLYELFDPRDVEFVLESYETIANQPLTIEDYGLNVEQTLVYLPEQHGVMCILHDVSAEQENKEKHDQLRMDAVIMAQKVIDRQMAAAQEIALLLGETTAETKVTLTQLKSIIAGNGDGVHI